MWVFVLLNVRPALSVRMDLERTERTRARLVWFLTLLVLGSPALAARSDHQRAARTRARLLWGLTLVSFLSVR